MAGLSIPHVITLLCICIVACAHGYIASKSVFAATPITHPPPIPITLSTNSNKCPENWVYFDEKCYFFSEQAMSWDEAVHFCEELDADLLELVSRLQSEFVRRVASRDAWLGASSAHNAYDYKWTASERKLANHYTNWDLLEPSCARCCVKVSVKRKFHWFTESCARSNVAICERDARSSARLIRRMRPGHLTRPTEN